jgi:hypothetical protein
MNLDEIEARANAATPGPWKYCADSDAIKGTNALIVRGARSNSGPFIAAARTDVPALIARVRELEAECERTRIFGSRKFAELRAADVEQMRAYGLSYEGVRTVLREYNDGEISLGKLMDLIRAAARMMAEAQHDQP